MEKLSFAVDTATTMAYMRQLTARSNSLPALAASASAAEAAAGGTGGGNSASDHVQDPISRPFLAWAVQVGVSGWLRGWLMERLARHAVGKVRHPDSHTRTPCPLSTFLSGLPP